MQKAIRLGVEKGAVIELLLTDVTTPEMNGPQPFKETAAFCPGIRVVYMSGYTEDEIMHHGVLREGIHLIQKPFTADSLTQKIRAALAE